MNPSSTMERNTRRIINHTNINLASSGARDSGEDASIIGTQNNNNNNGYSINSTGAGDHPTTTSTTIVNSSSTTSAAGNHSNDIVIVPHENDILLGRGGNNNKHSGNNQLRVLARDLVLQYVNSSKKGKSHLSRLLVRQVRQMKPPGRFLKQHRFTREWTDVGDKVAREKASQVLRDAIMLFANKNMKNKKKMHTSTATTTATASSTSWSDEKDHATGLQKEDNLWKENDGKKSFQDRKVTSSTSSSIATSCKSSMMMVSTNCSSPGSKYDLAPSTTSNQSSTRRGFPKASGVSSRRTTTGASPSLLYYDSLCSHDNSFPWVLYSGNTTATTSSSTTTYHLPAPPRRIVTPSSSRDRYYYNQEIMAGTTSSSFSNSSPKLNTFSYDASHAQDQHDEAQQQDKGDNNNNITSCNDDEDDDDISIMLYHQQQQQSLNHKYQGTDYHHMDLSQFDYPPFDHWDSMSFFDI